VLPPKESVVPCGDSEFVALLPAAKSGGLLSAVPLSAGLVFSFVSAPSLPKEFFRKLWKPRSFNGGDKALMEIQAE
jgi:hypothetical protein